MKTLAKEFSPLQVQFSAGLYNFSPGIANSGWRQVVSGQGAFVASTYFDLAGMSMNDETLFFEAAGVQELQNPTFSPATVGDQAIVVDIMSQVPLTDQEVINYATNGNFNVTNTSTLSFEQTIYGRVRLFNVDIDNQASNSAIVLSDNQSGSMSPTATDRIYCYRYAGFVMQTPGFLTLYPARYLLKANAKEEPEYEYLMRLKRSYELQQRFDRD